MKKSNSVFSDTPEPFTLELFQESPLALVVLLVLTTALQVLYLLLSIKEAQSTLNNKEPCPGYNG